MDETTYFLSVVDALLAAVSVHAARRFAVDVTQEYVTFSVSS